MQQPLCPEQAKGLFIAEERSTTPGPEYLLLPCFVPSEGIYIAEGADDQVVGKYHYGSYR